MRLTYDIGRWVGRVWARAQLRRDPSWLTPRHQVERSVTVRAVSMWDRQLEVEYTCQGLLVTSASSGIFRRHGRMSAMPTPEAVSVAVAACDGQLLSDCDLDLARVWLWWVTVCEDFSLFIGQSLDRTAYMPLRRRLARARSLAQLYPYSYHHRQVTSWLLDLGTQWPEDSPSHEQQIQLDKSVSECLVVTR